MLKLKKIAVTGGIACGKSTVCQLFRNAGAYVVSADAIAHELLDSHDLGQQVVAVLGSDILQNGKINRNIVASIVFQDKERLRELEKILHPVILKQIEQKYVEACNKGSYSAFVVEMPLLYEIGAEHFYDVVIAVQSTQHFPVPNDYERRKSRMLPDEVKAARANYTISNSGTLEDLEREVEKIIIKESKHS